MDIKIYTLKYSLIFLLLPAAVFAQESLPVNPVISQDYKRLISADTLRRSGLSSGNTLQVKRMSDAWISVRNIRIRRNTLVMQPDYHPQLLLSGSYNATVAFRTVGREPVLQSIFAQGRSIAGALAWQGPESNEAFSYGPPLRSLQFDGHPYPYDVNGKLVPSDAGNGHNANAYRNSIFRTASLFSQSFSLQGKVLENNHPVHNFSLRLGQRSENTFIRYNSNHAKYLEAVADEKIKWLRITGKYNYSQEQFSNSNRNGLLNRAYQQSILTPVSFDNGQGYTLGTGQRSYSRQADNPWFLLQDNDNYFRAARQRVSLILERNVYSKMKYTVTQSLDHNTERSSEGYKPGSANFPGGMPLYRDKQDRQYQLKGEASKDIHYGGYQFNSSFSASYIFSGISAGIRYQPAYAGYHYQRSAHEMMIGYRTTYNGKVTLTLDLGNHAYVSNTAARDNYFLPAVSLSADYNIGHDGWHLSLASSLLHFNTELPVTGSIAAANLLRYSVEHAGNYFPVLEVAGYDGLNPVQHREWAGNIALYNNRILHFSAGLFQKNTEEDLFPVYENGQYLLRTAGNHQSKGADLALSILDMMHTEKGLHAEGTLTFYSYRSKVTAVYGDASYLPLAGFSDVHTAFVKGQPLGVIVGSAWKKDAAGNRVIGPDGFPLADDQPAVIGDPNPDFVMKMSNRLRWQRFSLGVNLEWKKGGERWNGTQAALDYYGRSQSTADKRGVSGYVFPGVLEDGSPNNIKVDFYNPGQPLENNRWVRYGTGGVAADYIQQADWLRINAIQINYKQPFRRIIQQVTLSAYVHNIMLWTAYDGVDPAQLLYDQDNSAGLDFFNLPATKTYGFNVSIQF